MNVAAGIVVALVAFVAMEPISYASHRWVMHGFGMRWHRSHHVASSGRWEANDIFPVLFSTVGVAAFAAAALGGASWLYWAGGGVTAYGLTYLFVHEVYIHRRLRSPIDDVAYLDWLRESHRIHHLFGTEPYGMLLPLVPRRLRVRAAERRTMAPSTRSRL